VNERTRYKTKEEARRGLEEKENRILELHRQVEELNQRVSRGGDESITALRAEISALKNQVAEKATQKDAITAKADLTEDQFTNTWNEVGALAALRQFIEPLLAALKNELTAELAPRAEFVDKLRDIDADQLLVNASTDRVVNRITWNYPEYVGWFQNGSPENATFQKNFQKLRSIRLSQGEPDMEAEAMSSVEGFERASRRVLAFMKREGVKFSETEQATPHQSHGAIPESTQPAPALSEKSPGSDFVRRSDLDKEISQRVSLQLADEQARRQAAAASTEGVTSKQPPTTSEQSRSETLKEILANPTAWRDRAKNDPKFQNVSLNHFSTPVGR
jgi:hypothetical protein